MTSLTPFPTGVMTASPPARLVLLGLLLLGSLMLGRPSHALDYTELHNTLPGHTRSQASIILPDSSERGWSKQAEAMLMSWRGQTGLIVTPPGKSMRWLVKLDALPIRASWPGTHIWRQTKKGEWEQWVFDNNLAKIQKVDDTPYSNMISFPGFQGVMAGLRPGQAGETDLDLISTVTGDILRTFAGVNTTLPIIEMDGVLAVQSQGFFWHVATAEWQTINYHTRYPRTVNFLPELYVLAGNYAGLNIAVRAGEPGSSQVDVFVRGERYTPALGKSLVEKNGVPPGFMLPDERINRFVMLRDDDITPDRYAALDLPHVQMVLDMRGRQGRPVGWAAEVKGSDGKPALHLLQIANDRRRCCRSDYRYFPGTFFLSNIAYQDVHGGSIVGSHNYLYWGRAFVSDGRFWERHRLANFEDPGSETMDSAGFLLSKAVENKKYDSLAALQAEHSPIDRYDPPDMKLTMTAEQIAQARGQYEIRQQAMLDAASASYQAAVRADEEERRARAARSAAEARAEMSAAFGSITNSLVKGATSSSPGMGSAGVNKTIYDNRYDSTGAGWRSYQQARERELQRKFNCRGTC